MVATIVTELPPQVDKEQDRDNGYTYRRIIELGYEDKNYAAKKELADILQYGFDHSTEKDTQWREMPDNRYQFTLNAVLGSIAEDPFDLEDKDSNSALRRQSAVEILNASYASLLMHNLPGAYRAAFAITKKLENPNEGTMKIMFMDSSRNPYLSRETHTILEFLKIIADNVENQPQDISVKVFDTILKNLKYTTDSHVYCEEEEILRLFLLKARKLESWELYNELIDTFHERMGELDINKPEDCRVLNNISSIYSQILSRERYHSPSSDKLPIYKRTFAKVLSFVKDGKDDRIRASLISPLGAAVLGDRDGRHKWEGNPRLLKQQLEFHIKTLETLTDIVNKQKHLKGNYLHDATPHLSYCAYRLLANMLKEYADGVESCDETWLRISEKHSSKYKLGLQALFGGVNKENEEIRNEVLRLIEDFLSPTALENANHPFRVEGFNFYKSYYSKRIDEEAHKIEK